MKKTKFSFKKIVATCLGVILLSTSMSISAFAEEKNIITYQKYSLDKSKTFNFALHISDMSTYDENNTITLYDSNGDNGDMQVFGEFPINYVPAGTKFWIEYPKNTLTNRMLVSISTYHETSDEEKNSLPYLEEGKALFVFKHDDKNFFGPIYDFNSSFMYDSDLYDKISEAEKDKYYNSYANDGSAEVTLTGEEYYTNLFIPTQENDDGTIIYYYFEVDPNLPAVDRTDYKFEPVITTPFTETRTDTTPQNNELSIVYNGQEMDFTPIIKNNSSFIKARQLVTETLGGEIAWDAEKAEITVTINNDVLVFGANSDTYTFNGEEKTSEKNPGIFIENGSTYVPVRFICEAFGMTVEYDNTTNTANITN